MDLIDQQNILDWRDVLTSCKEHAYAFLLSTRGPGHGECYIMQTQKQLYTCHKKRQKTFPATSSSTSNVIYQPHWPTRRTQVQPVDPSARGPFAAAKYNHITTTWPPPLHHQFHSTPSSNAWWLSSCWGQQPLPAKGVINLASLVTSRNNIYPLTFNEVRHYQCLSVSVSVCQVKATSGQLISNGFTGLSPFIAASIILRQIDVNDRFVRLQGCG